MTARVFWATFLGAIILFAWTSVSWMVYPFHVQSQLRFNDEVAVSKVIQANAPVSGIYLLPNPYKADPKVEAEKSATPGAKPPASKPIAEKAAATGPSSMDMQKTGPIVFASVLKTGVTSMTPTMIIQFANFLVAAFLFALMLAHVKARHFFCRLAFVIIFAITVAVISDVSYWNWWNFSKEFTLLAMADKVIGWTLAGFVMTLIIRCKKGMCTPQGTCTTECKTTQL